VGFLAIVAVMPVSTEFLANFIGFRIAPVVCWLNILRLGGVVRHLALRPHPQVPDLYAIGAALCLVSTT